jgi:hypothetical protein
MKRFLAGLTLLAMCGSPATAQVKPALAVAGPELPGQARTDYSKWSTAALNAELSKKAIIQQKVLMPMRDGVHLSTDVYRPKAGGLAPVIFIRTPYNMNVPGDRDLRMINEGIDRGYAFVLQNERGRYFSEGKWEILGFPRTDGYDALTWISDQPWSNHKVGTYGCSSTAEWQLQLAAMHHPAHAAMIPQSAGAGIGRVG